MSVYIGNAYLTSDNKIALFLQGDSDFYNPRKDDEGNICKFWLGKACDETSYENYEALLKHYKVTRDPDHSIKVGLRNDIKALKEAGLKRGDYILPVSVYQHSGEAFFIGHPHDHFDGEWDCSFCGFIIADKKTIKEKLPSDVTPDQIEKAMERELQEWAAWRTGDILECCIYPYEIKDGEIEVDELDAEFVIGFNSGDSVETVKDEYDITLSKELGENFSSIDDVIDDDEVKNILINGAAVGL